MWGWYEWRRQKVMLATPNAGHHAIAEFTARAAPRVVHVVTQNVDDLHERAGSSGVIHLHGRHSVAAVFSLCDACTQHAG